MNKNLKTETYSIDDNEEYIKKLNSDTLLDDDTFIRYFDIETQLDRTKYLTAARRKAKSFSLLKEFNDLLRAWQTEYNSKMNVDGYNSIDFTDAPIKDLRCGSWEATDKGVKDACPHPIMPVERLYNLDTETEKIKLAFFKDSRWQYVTVDRAVCADKTSIVRNLANRGVEVTSKNAAQLVEYIADVVRLNPYAISRKDAVSRMGWVGKSFAPYDDKIQYDGDQQFKGLYDAISTKGDFEAWKDYCSDLRKESLFLRMQMAASFASPLIEKVQALPFIFHLWGGTGAGKTVGMMVALSIWGDPALGKLVRTMNMTKNNMALICSFLNSIPFAGDELQLIKQNHGNYDDIIMFLCEGVDRGRNTSRSAAEKLKTWRNVFLFTGEEPITKSDSGGGAKNRVIEAYVSGKVVSEGNAAVSFISENYGFAGKIFIEEIRRRKDIKKRYDEIVKTLLDSFDTTEKQAMSLGLMILADEIATDCIFKDDKPLELEDMKDFLASERDVNIGNRVYEYIVDLVSANANRFCEADNHGEIWGKLDPDNDVLIINRLVLKEQLEKAGFDMQSTLRQLDNMKKLIRNSQGRTTHQTRVFGQKANYIKISLKTNEEPTDDELKNMDLPF